MDRHPAFFGYGSLVNRATHDHAPAQPARLSGWRRVWRQTRLRPYAFLSAEPAPGVGIDGILAAVPGGDWAALDAREAAYDRRALPPASVADPAPWAGTIAIYAVSDRHAAPAGTAHPLLLSYLDTVVQGFLREWGPEGAAGFFATTAGWDTAILDDRAAPVYPRHQPLTPAERAIVDDNLHRRDARILRG